MSNKQILVVDDEENIVKSCTRILSSAGYQPVGATSGPEAVELFQEEQFDMVLVDLRMPSMDGLQVLSEVKALQSEIPVVVITAYGTKETAVDAFRLGAAEFLEKPLQTELMVETVQRILDDEKRTTVRGNIATLSLSNIIQFNCMEQNMAYLRVRKEGSEGSIYFNGGEVVHAVLDSNQGEEAVYELLTWNDGAFELEMGKAPPMQTIEKSWSSLLMEAKRRIDERGVGERDRCSECGSFVGRHGRCSNPGCPAYDERADFWEGMDFDQNNTNYLAPTEVNEMAKLQDLLKEMANDIPGFLSTDVVGMDGLSIGGYANDPDFDNEAASAQFALVMKLVQKTVSQLEAGEVEDNLVTTDGGYIITRLLGDGSYYLGIAINRDEGSLGNVRLITRNYADKLWDAIPK